MSLRRATSLVLTASLVWLHWPAECWAAMAAASRASARPITSVTLAVPALGPNGAGLGLTAPAALSTSLQPSLPNVAPLQQMKSPVLSATALPSEAGSAHTGSAVSAITRDNALPAAPQRRVEAAFPRGSARSAAVSPRVAAQARAVPASMAHVSLPAPQRGVGTVFTPQRSGPAARTGLDIAGRPDARRLSALFDGTKQRGNAVAPDTPAQAKARTSPRRSGLRKFLRKVSKEVRELVNSPPPDPDKPPPLPGQTRRNILKGALLGLILTVSPLATIFALAPLDAALGLSPYNFAAGLFEIYPALGIAVYLVREWGLGLLVLIGGLNAVLRGLGPRKGPPKDRAEAVQRLNRLFKLMLPVMLLAGGVAAGIVFNIPWLMLPALIAFSVGQTIVLATGEEVMFRGYFFRRLLASHQAKKRHLPLLRTVLVTAFVFSAVHILLHGLTLNLLVLKFIAGIVFGLVYHRSGLPAAAAAHAVYNLSVGHVVGIFGPVAWHPYIGGAAWVILIGSLLLIPRLFPANKLARAPPRKLRLSTSNAPGVVRKRAETILKALALRAGMRRAPKLEVLRSGRVNAASYKSGRRILVTTGLLGFLNERELAAVLAHELGHLHKGVRRVAAYTVYPSLAIYAVVGLGLYALGFLPWNIMIGGTAAMAASYYGVVRYFRQEEFTADAFAKRLMGEGRTLASVLRKLPGSDPAMPERVRRLEAEDKTPAKRGRLFSRSHTPKGTNGIASPPVLRRAIRLFKRTDLLIAWGVPILQAAAFGATLALLHAGLPLVAAAIAPLAAAGALLGFLKNAPERTRAPARILLLLSAAAFVAYPVFYINWISAITFFLGVFIADIAVLPDMFRRERYGRLGVPAPIVRDMVKSPLKGKSLDPQAREWLADLIGSREDRRRAVSEMIARPEEARALQDAVSSLTWYGPETEVKLGAIELLGKWGDTESIGLLMLHAAGKGDDASRAREVLQELKARREATERMDALARTAREADASSEIQKALDQARAVLGRLPERTLITSMRREALERRIRELEDSVASRDEDRTAVALARLKLQLREASLP